MRSVCEIRECTACGLCSYKCPKECISIHRVKGLRYAVIDEEQCINCGMCEDVCPSIKEVKRNTPIKAYAAWNMDVEDRRTSASGGIATALYKWALKNNYFFIGVDLDENFEANYCLGKTSDDITRFQNSKYTFSCMNFEQTWGVLSPR